MTCTIYILAPNRNHLLKAVKMFPSPLGVSYFQMHVTQMNVKLESAVSVPSRGILFPNSYYKNGKLKDIKEFPSPLGVSYFQIDIIFYGCCKHTTKFPSPLGVSYFQIIILAM